MDFATFLNPYWWILPIGIIVALYLNKRYPHTLGKRDGDLTVHTGYVPSEDPERLNKALNTVDAKIVEWYLSPNPSPRLGAFLERTRSELRLQLRVLVLREKYSNLRQIRDETNNSSRLTG
jgi:hypothetical protein